MSQRLGAEFLGTFWLVFGGCGSAVLAAAFPELGIGFVGVSLAFGLTVLTMAYAIGPHLGLPLQPGGHGRPVGRRPLQGGRHPAVHRRAGARRDRGGAPSSTLIASGKAGFDLAGAASPPTATASTRRAATRWSPAFVAEVVLTFFFLIVILGATDTRAPAGFAPIAIGLALTLIHLIGIPVTNTSVNPARSTGPALFVGGWALAQLWLFWVAPIVGAALAGATHKWLAASDGR